MGSRARVRELFAQGSRNWDRGLLGSTFGEDLVGQNCRDQRKVLQEPRRDRLIWKSRVRSGRFSVPEGLIRESEVIWRLLWKCNIH